MADNHGAGAGGSGASGGSGGGGMAADAASAMRDAASSASDMAGSVYEEGSRYLRQASDYLPDVGGYADVVRRPVEQSPVVAALVAGLIGYLAAYLIHGGGFRSLQGVLPDYNRDDGRGRRNNRRR